MPSLLLKNIRAAVTCDDNDHVLELADIFCENGFIQDIGPHLSQKADQVIDCSDMLCYPGLVNTHHHLYQCSPGTCPRYRTWSCLTGSGPSMRSGRTWMRPWFAIPPLPPWGR